MSAISSLCLYSLNMHKYICTPSNIDSLCSLWQAQAVCFCGLMSPLYLSVITLELSDPKTEGSPRRVPALLAEGPHLPSLISSLTPPFILQLRPPIDQRLSRKPTCPSMCAPLICVSRQPTFLPPTTLPGYMPSPPPPHYSIRGAFSGANED